jgi:hypothetical protein
MGTLPSELEVAQPIELPQLTEAQYTAALYASKPLFWELEMVGRAAVGMKVARGMTVSNACHKTSRAKKPSAQEERVSECPPSACLT